MYQQSTEQVDLTKSLFQFCFSFTMKQKLAPLWNKAGEFLVQGIVIVHCKIRVKLLQRETPSPIIMRAEMISKCVERIVARHICTKVSIADAIRKLLRRKAVYNHFF